MRIHTGFLIGALAAGLLGLGVAGALLVDIHSDGEASALSSPGKPHGDLCNRRKTESRELKRGIDSGRIPTFAALTNRPERFRALPRERPLPAVLQPLISPDRRVSIGYHDMPGHLLAAGTVVSFRLTRISRSGVFEQTVAEADVPFDTKHRHPPYFDVPVPDQVPALFELDANITRYGSELRSYRNYFYVPSGHPSVRLLLDRHTTSPGEGVYAAPANDGPTALTYGLAYRLERLDDGRWTEVPLEHGGVFALVGIGVGAGMTGKCVPVGVPESAEPGTYRVALLDGADPEGSPRSKRLPLRARFRVEEEP